MDRPGPGVEIVIAHHGIKGQKWGVRRKNLSESDGSSSKEDVEYTKQAAKIQKHLKSQGLDSKNLEAKYGKEGFRLTPREKKALIVGGIAAAVIGLSVVESRSGTGRSAATTKRAYEEAVNGLELNWHEGVHLPAGTVLKRISTVAESEAREGGFFAAHRSEDVESYKAILPTFWRVWGVGSPKAGGFINEYTAKAAIKAPSGKESVDVFKELLKDKNFVADLVGPFRSNPISENEIKPLFEEFSHAWVVPDVDIVQQYFSAVKSKGYNALIDFNDAGKLGKQPLRVLDSSIFDITKNVPLKYDDIKEAALSWAPELVHSIIFFAKGDQMQSNRSFMQDFLAHHGIKGQKWGVRRAHPSAVTVVARPGKKVKVSGGHKLPAHEDAILARTAAQKAKKSSTDALSNKELQGLVTRMNLEQQLSSLKSKNKGVTAAGAKFAGDIVSNVAKQQVTKLANDAVSKKIGEALNKK